MKVLKHYFLFYSLLTCVFDLNAQSIVAPDKLRLINQSDEIERIIAEEAIHLDTMICPTKIWMTDAQSIPTQYDVTFGVIINKPRLVEYIHKFNFSDPRFFVRFIVAHEKYHAIQTAMIFRNSGRTIASFTEQEKQLFECQADMCAGYIIAYPVLKEYGKTLTDYYVLWYRLQKDPQMTHSNITDINNEDINMAKNLVQGSLSGLSLFFELGENEGSFTTHPSSVSRKRAFEVGMDAMNITALNIGMNTPEARTFNADEWGYLQNLYLLQCTELEIFPSDFNMNHSFFDSWGYRMSQQVNHFYSENAKAVTFKINDFHTISRPAPDNSMNYYTITVSNVSNDSIWIDWCVAEKTVPKDNPDDPLHASISAATHSMRILAPHQTYITTDSVFVPLSSDSTINLICLPGEEGSLYSVIPISYLRSGFKPINSGQMNPALSQDFIGDERSVSQKLMSFMGILRGPDEITNFIEGAGLVLLNSEYVDYTLHQFIKQGLVLHMPIKSGDRPYFSVEFAKEHTITNALNVFNEIQKGINTITNFKSVEVSNKPIGVVHQYVITSNDNSQKYALILEKHKDYYSVSVNIYSYN